MQKQARIKSACIIVLGDVGRSPRMEYHAQSLIDENFHVDIIGYMETKPLDSLLSAAPQCIIHELSQIPLTTLPPKLKYIFKTVWQSLSLLMALISIQRPKFILVQNPPAIPTFVVCYIYCFFMRSKFVVDWHNYTHSILALTEGSNSVIVSLAKWIEKFFGRKAHAHFCVTKALKDDLKINWDINAVVLYDRPALQFQPVELEKKHELFMKFSKDYSQFLPKDCADFKESGVMESTALTQKMSDGTVVYKISRPAILVSSTSWTPDEDFEVLLKALEEYEHTARESSSYPNLLCIITGKGPQKEFYKSKICKMSLNKVSIITPWLEAEDYPTVLASADLGVSLHWSSSGLDLPMKVVDMFGCGLPVCAINFKCLNELVEHEQTGFVFDDYQQLSQQLKLWFKDFPKNSSLLRTKETFRKNLDKFQSLRWNENWTLNALPVLNSFK